MGRASPKEAKKGFIQAHGIDESPRSAMSFNMVVSIFFAVKDGIELSHQWWAIEQIRHCHTFTDTFRCRTRDGRGPPRCDNSRLYT